MSDIGIPKRGTSGFDGELGAGINSKLETGEIIHYEYVTGLRGRSAQVLTSNRVMNIDINAPVWISDEVRWDDVRRVRVGSIKYFDLKDGTSRPFPGLHDLEPIYLAIARRYTSVVERPNMGCLGAILGW